MEQFKIDSLSFSYHGYDEVKSLRNVSLTVDQGEYILLCGSSGSGKTTLLRHLKTVLMPHGKRKGSVCFNGTDLKNVPESEQAFKIGYVMQSPDDQIVTDKVWHELAFGLEGLGYDQQSIRIRVAEMANYFGIQDWFHRKVSELSGGQKQLLNLASVMAMQPDVLILDEPTSQLDPIAAADFLNTVRKINFELGTTVIITEHRLEDIFPYVDRVVVMDDGQIIADDIPAKACEKLFEQKSSMLYAMPTPVRIFYSVGSVGKAPLTVREGRAWLKSEFLNEIKHKEITSQPNGEIKEAALSLKEVWFRYKKDSPDVLKGISLEVEKGSIHAIVGGNGAGKSTTFKAICGICKPYRGKIKIFGKNQEKYKSNELFNNCISMLPQNISDLFVKKTVEEELREMTKDRAEIERVAQICRITRLMSKHPYDLSGGEGQRVALAKVLLTHPRILLLDEPTKGMDSFFKLSFAEILKELQAQGITCVMVSHDIEFCAEHADRVSMFFDGGITATDTQRNFFCSNSFYTTQANRMSRQIFNNAVTCEDVIELYNKNRGECK